MNIDEQDMNIDEEYMNIDEGSVNGDEVCTSSYDVTRHHFGDLLVNEVAIPPGKLDRQEIMLLKMNLLEAVARKLGRISRVTQAHCDGQRRACESACQP
jgi:hypothetical protein